MSLGNYSQVVENISSRSSLDLCSIELWNLAMIFDNKVGTLFVNLFQLAGETINGTVTSVFI